MLARPMGNQMFRSLPLSRCPMSHTSAWFSSIHIELRG
jgi:hypothetical protein